MILDHKPARARRLARKGVTIETAGSSRRIRVPALFSAKDLGTVGVIFLCVKASDTRAAVSGAAPAIGPETIVVSLQNGIGNAETIARLVPTSRVMCGVTGQGAINLGPGHVFHAGEGKTRIAALAPQSNAAARRVAVLLRAAGLDASWARDAHAMLWGKLIVNAAINPLSALLNVPNGRLLDDPAARGVMFEAAAEAAAVAKACGVCLQSGNPAHMVARACRATAFNISSMLQDVRRRRKTEIEYITGAVVRAASRHDVAVPVNRRLLSRVRELERHFLQ